MSDYTFGSIPKSSSEDELVRNRTLHLGLVEAVFGDELAIKIDVGLVEGKGFPKASGLWWGQGANPLHLNNA